jgi:methionyl-tRNA formyltransferase
MVNWNSSSREIFNFVRAICHPGPQATTRLNGHLIKINRVELLQDAPVYKGKPGAILGAISDRPLVKTADSFVELVDFSAEIPLKMGDRFE